MPVKSICLDQLRVGMYIVKMKCGWLNHPFFQSSFQVTARKESARLVAHGVAEAYIETIRGLDVQDFQTEAEVQCALDANLNAILNKTGP